MKCDAKLSAIVTGSTLPLILVHLLLISNFERHAINVHFVATSVKSNQKCKQYFFQDQDQDFCVVSDHFIEDSYKQCTKLVKVR